MSEPTAARPNNGESSHWYLPDGTPFYEVMGKTTGRPRPVTVKDAKGVALPSVTTILKVLNKPGLNAWMIEQACLAVLTAPRKDGEQLDAFVERVLPDAEQEAEKARSLGSDIHDALDKALSGNPFDPALGPYIMPALDWCKKTGAVKRTEFVVVGPDYAGRVDADLAGTLVDFKTSKTIPKPGSEPWPEHAMQLEAYRRPAGANLTPVVLYISTVEPGKIVPCPVLDNDAAFAAFEAAKTLWRFTLGRSWEPPKPKLTIEQTMDNAGL